jgi:arginyl-tRNA synthetase
MKAKKIISENLAKVIKKISDEDVPFVVQPSEKSENGEYFTNIALRLGSKLGKKPLDIAYEIKNAVEKNPDFQVVSKVEVVPPGFVNFFLTDEYINDTVSYINKKSNDFGLSDSLKGKKIMVEFAHPNTHKEMHIGHMRTLITGEALSRLFESQGAEVFRANYQGDIGPHVAKALWGIQRIMEEEDLTLDQIENWSNIGKAHFLGRGYVRGNQDYEKNKEEIDGINTKLYNRDKSIWAIYETTRKWNLDYYDDFYKRFYTKFDRLFFESEMDEPGKKIVDENTGKVFEEESGAVIFPGEKYNLHTRVFITAVGHPTYEGKEMANGYAEYNAFPFDRKIHVVASEQAGYFKVVFKALELIDPPKFMDRQYHVSMGMVHLSDTSTGSVQARKMSSRTGDILTVDWLIDEVKERVRRTIDLAKVTKNVTEEVLEPVTIGAIKYSVLKHGTGQDVAFNIDQSVTLDGDSGPYLQYTYVRTQSVLMKSKNEKRDSAKNYVLNSEEKEILRQLIYFPDTISEAAERMSPNLLASYLFDLAQKFNIFYQKHKIQGNSFRLNLTAAGGQVLKNGLGVLGIETVDKM